MSTTDYVPSLRELKLMGRGKRRGSSPLISREINEIIPEGALKKIKGPGL